MWHHRSALALSVLCVAWRFAGVSGQSAFDTSFQRRSEGDTFLTDVNGYCQHSFGGRVCALALYLPVVVCPPLHSCWPLLGAQVHGGWTAVASSALDAAALSGVSRQEAALSFAPADLPSQRCHTGLVGAGSYSADGSLFNASNTCQHYPGNPAQLLGGADLWGRPSTCGCMQVPQCDRGHQCEFDCGCTVKDQDVAQALQAALLEPEVLLFHATLLLERGLRENVTCAWNVTHERQCFAATGGASLDCDFTRGPSPTASPLARVPGARTEELAEAAHVNGSLPLSSVFVRGYSLRIQPVSSLGNPAELICLDEEAHNYRQWECSVHGLFSVSGRNSSAANASATTLLPTTFEQHFDMRFLKTGSPTSPPNTIPLGSAPGEQLGAMAAAQSEGAVASGTEAAPREAAGGAPPATEPHLRAAPSPLSEETCCSIEVEGGMLGCHLVGDLAKAQCVVAAVHGAGQSCLVWGQLLHQLRKFPIAAVLLDLPCHGASTGFKCEELSLATMVQACGEALDKVLQGRVAWPKSAGQQGTDSPLGLPLALIGHSVGGGVVSSLSQQAMCVPETETLWPCIRKHLRAVALLDCLPDLALEGTDALREFLTQHRPESFTSLAEAAAWHVQAGVLASQAAGLASLPGALRQEPGGRWVWRTDLLAAEEHWADWLQGATEGILALPRSVTLQAVVSMRNPPDAGTLQGEMSGRVSTAVLPAGHQLQENAPDKVAALLCRVWLRHGLLGVLPVPVQSAQPA